MKATPRKLAIYGTVTFSAVVELAVISEKVKLSWSGIEGPARSPSLWEYVVPAVKELSTGDYQI